MVFWTEDVWLLQTGFTGSDSAQHDGRRHASDRRLQYSYIHPIKEFPLPTSTKHQHQSPHRHQRRHRYQTFYESPSFDLLSLSLKSYSYIPSSFALPTLSLIRILASLIVWKLAPRVDPSVRTPSTYMVQWSQTSNLIFRKCTETRILQTKNTLCSRMTLIKTSVMATMPTMTTVPPLFQYPTNQLTLIWSTPYTASQQPLRARPVL
jgi:hypothetical protein